MNKYTSKINYYWSGKTEDGRSLSGVIQAMSPNLARLYLLKQGITGIKIKPKKLTFFSRKKLTPTENIAFFRQLATLLSAGIPILQCCDLLSQTQSSESFQTFILECRKEIATGQTLSVSLKKFPHFFDPVVCQLVLLGEQSGTLDKTLQTIADYKEKSLALKKKIFQALFYPSIVITTALIISIIMLTCVVPRFEELFNNMHTKLPLFTQGVVSLSHFLCQNSWLGLIFIPAVCTFYYFFKNSPSLHEKIDSLTLKTPIAKNILQKIVAARFARHFATLFAAGIPIVEGLKITAPILSNHHFVQALEQVQKEISRGQRLYVAMQKHTSFPILVIQMIKIGEESGTLETMLYKLAEQYESDIDYWVTHLSQLLEPLIMIILGVLIGGLVIAMYLPIFKLGTVI